MRASVLHSHCAPIVAHRAAQHACHAIPQRPLATGAPNVSVLSFGTMLFGEGTDARTAHRLLDAALDAGVSFFDTSEMYPVPQRAATQGASERILGDWLRRTDRSRVTIATKVAGPSGEMTWLRGGPASLDAANIAAAIDASLLRLQVDCLDVVYLHWPDRYVPMFGQVHYDPRQCYKAVPLEEQYQALRDAIDQAKQAGSGAPQPTSLQNAYSLTCRTFEAGMAECCHQEGVGLVAYSPLAMGLLTGKYLLGASPEARLNKYRGRYAEAESRYGPKPNMHEAVSAYAALAAECGMSPTELALRFVLTNPLVSSALTGATSVDQLKELADAASKGPLDDEVMAAVDAVHWRYPNPTP